MSYLFADGDTLEQAGGLNGWTNKILSSAPASFSIAAWIRPGDSSVTDRTAVALAQAGAGTSPIAQLWCNDSATSYYPGTRAGLSAATVVDGSIDAAAVGYDRWYLVVSVFTWGGSNYTSVDTYCWYSGYGASAAKTSSASLTSTLSADLDNVIVGSVSRSAGSQNWIGKIAEISIWNTALDQTDVDLLTTRYASAIGAKYTSNCVNYWQLSPNGDAVVDLTDQKGSQNLVSLTGTPAANADHPTLSSGSSTATISSLSASSFVDGQASITITGTNFGAVEGTVIISPTDDSTDVNAVGQTVTSWGDTSIVFTSVRSTLSLATTLYLFVIPDTNDPNTNGESVQFVTLITLMGQAVF